MVFIKPWEQTQDLHVERFNRTYQTEVLDTSVFGRLSKVQEIPNSWIRKY
ncbi:MAG: transposase [Candidatus Nitrohelix vancouverensis]|uniref:Transposase n=1 Tax=Candidatus Nitrohelix vancouverensis TaxID=2705534 RepID=A0A7T0C465_9BACT|nr:MAG: transposase [Candidatus Nitrohelix vancouverensis]